MYFHTDDDLTIAQLAEVVTRASAEGRRLRFNVYENGSLSFKVGESMWSSPIPSTPDPYRDATCDRHGGPVGGDETCPCTPESEVGY